MNLADMLRAQSRPHLFAAVRAWQGEWHCVIFALSLLVILAHLVNAALFDTSAGLALAFLYVAGALVGVVSGLVIFPSAGHRARAVLAFAYGFPALVVGIGIHGVHAARLGLLETDPTGLALIAAGLALLLLALARVFQRLRPWPLRLVLLPAMYVLVIYLIVPVSFGISAANVVRLPNDLTPSTYGLSFEAVSFLTEDGHRIRAWYIPSENGAAIITVHGASGNRSNTVEHADLLARHGFGVLMIDVQGFGESDGQSNNYGWFGAGSVAAAVDYLNSRADVHPDRIGGLGLSMGGEILLTTAAEVSELRAIVVEGASVRTWHDYRDLPEADWLAAPAFLLAVTVTQVISGAPEPAPFTELVPSISPRPVLLISADLDEERQMNRVFQDLGGSAAELWEIPESAHTRALALHPEEYERRVVGFFEQSLSAK